MEKEKAKEKENRPEKASEDLVADAEEEKVADAEKDEAKVDKEKESSLDKWVRKVTEDKESLVERVKDLCATIVEELVTSPQSVTRIQEKERAKERVYEMFTVNTRVGVKKENSGMRNGRIGTTMKDSSSASKHSTSKFVRPAEC